MKHLAQERHVGVRAALGRSSITLVCSAALPANAADPVRILAYGDSNSWGWIATESGFPSTRLDDGDRWAGVLERELDEALGGIDATVVVDGLTDRTVVAEYPADRAGVAGDALVGVEDIDTAVAAALPLDLVVVMLGTNDARSDLAAEPDAVADGLARMALIVRDTAGGIGSTYAAPDVLVVAPPTIGDTTATPIDAIMTGATARSSAISAAIVARGAADGIATFDAGDHVTLDGVDGVHLGAEQHERLGRALAERVSRLLDRRSGG